jgi:hypothetical protein
VGGEAGSPELGDAFGHALLDRAAGVASPIVVEREDGYITADTFDYLAMMDQRDQWALDRAVGRSVAACSLTNRSSGPAGHRARHRSAGVSWRERRGW